MYENSKKYFTWGVTIGSEQDNFWFVTSCMVGPPSSEGDRLKLIELSYKRSPDLTWDLFIAAVLNLSSTLSQMLTSVRVRGPTRWAANYNSDK